VEGWRTGRSLKVWNTGEKSGAPNLHQIRLETITAASHSLLSRSKAWSHPERAEGEINIMTSKPIMAAVALALAASTAAPLSAQAYRGYTQVPAYNADAFWRGAPDGIEERIDWLQQRIQQGAADGSLTRAEQRRIQYQLDQLRRDAGILDDRLDNLSRNIRWARSPYGDNGAYGYNGGVGRDPYATDYDAYRYYREDPRYPERRLTAQDEVYRGSDGRYYCKRNDGTIGLVVGGVGGAALGNVIDGGRNRVAGTLIGGALGALLGRALDQNSTDVRCR
jgi:hypothetical protein